MLNPEQTPQTGGNPLPNRIVNRNRSVVNLRSSLPDVSEDKVNQEDSAPIVPVGAAKIVNKVVITLQGFGKHSVLYLCL